MRRVRQEARRQRARLVAVTGGVAAVAGTALLLVVLMVPGASRGPAPSGLPSRPAFPAVTAKVPSSCRVVTRAVTAAGLPHGWGFGMKFRGLVPVGGLGFGNSLFCSYGPKAGPGYLSVSVGKESIQGLEAHRAAKHWSARTSHLVPGVGLWAFTAAPPGTGESVIVAQNAQGLAVEVVSSLTLRQDIAVIRHLFARL